MQQGQPLEQDSVSLSQGILFRLGCEVGQTVVSLQDLQSLHQGTVLPFENQRQTVFLTVNVVRAGEAVLVDVEGKLGVKITRWWHGGN